MNTAEYAVVHGIFLKAVISSFKNRLRPVCCKVSGSIWEGRQVGLLHATFPNNAISSSKTILNRGVYAVSRINPPLAQVGLLHEGYRHNAISSSKTILRLLQRLIIKVHGIFPKAAISFFKKHMQIAGFCAVSFFKKHLRVAFCIGGQTNLVYGAFLNSVISFFKIHSLYIQKSEGL